jgi:glucokinase
MDKLLLIDIGGTHIRHAIASSNSNEITEINKDLFSTKNFENIIQGLIETNNINVLIISAAGPKIGNTISMTNRNYVFDSAELKEKFNLKECYILNDWEAIGHSYKFVNENIKIIKDGQSFNDNTLFLGPGTGLGAALAVGDEIVIPTEIGNTNNSIKSFNANFTFNIEKELTLENIISGTGISYLYKQKTGIELKAEDIFKKFLDKDNDAEEIINGFIKCLAQTLSDLSLTFIPGNGILLAGSLMRSIYPHIISDEFKDSYIGTKKGIHKDMLEMISIGVITKEKTPLYGNLGFYKKLI